MEFKIHHTCRAANFTNLKRRPNPVQTPCIAYGHMQAPSLQYPADVSAFKGSPRREFGRVFPKRFKFTLKSKQC